MESIIIDLILLSISWNTTIKSGCKYRLSFSLFFQFDLNRIRLRDFLDFTFFFHSFMLTLLEKYFSLKRCFPSGFFFSSISIGFSFREMCTYWFLVIPECMPVRAPSIHFFFLLWNFLINVCNHKTVKNSPESDKWNTFKMWKHKNTKLKE